MPILYTIESLLLYICISVLLVKIYQNKLSITNLLFTIVYIPLFLYANKIDYYIYMFSYPIQAIFNIILLKISYRTVKIASILYAYVFFFCLNTILTTVSVAVFPVNKYYLEAIIYTIILIFCLIATCTSINTSLRQTIYCTPKTLKILILIVLILLSFINTLLYGVFDEPLNETWLLMIQILTLLMIVSIFILLPLAINHAIKNQQLKQLTENYQKQLEAQAKHYSAVAKNNWDLRRFQHDSKNLQVGLSELIESGNSQEALNMLNNYYELSQGSKESSLKFDTGNGIVDALLADKQQIAQEFNTTINFDGVVPSVGITPTDLCVIFGNTLDNAIDACKKFPVETPKNINVISKCISGFLLINISNPVVEDVVIHKNTIPTTKADKTAHGFGLYSLKQVTKKMDGNLKLKCQNNLFETSIDLTLDI